MKHAERTSIPEQDLRVLLDHAPDAIARFDRRLRHVYVNEATARANGRPASDFYGQTMEDLGHLPHICDLINLNVRAVFASGQECTVELVFPGPHGDVAYQCRMAPEMDEAGSVEYVLVVSRDITQLRRAEAALLEATRNAAETRMLKVLAHEINNPLTVLFNTGYLLRESPSLDATAQQYVSMMQESLDRIREIARRLLSGADAPSESDDAPLPMPTAPEPRDAARRH